jgi:phytoene dehydrogenase-like protein
MSDRKDVVVIGASVGGLAAAAYLARVGHRVLVLEADDALSGACRGNSSIAGVRSSYWGASRALDSRLISDLGLRSLKFAVRDMPLVALREDGRHLVLTRDARIASRAIATYSSKDASTYRRVREEISRLALAMRPFWWNDVDLPLQRNAKQAQLLERFTSTSAVSYLNEIESPAVKAALAFDADRPLEPGSALALAWTAAQESCGLQGAVAAPLGGLSALGEALAAAAQNAGAEIRTRACAKSLELDGGAVRGLTLDTGEAIFGRVVISSLSRRRTILDLAPTASAGFAQTQSLLRSQPHCGEAYIQFLLNAAPALGGTHVPQSARFVIADPETYAATRMAVREGRLPDELLLEIMTPTTSDHSAAPMGQHLLSVRVPDLPLKPGDGWPALTGKLIERVIATLEPFAAHLRERIVGTDVRTPLDEEENSVERILAPYAARIVTPIEGLFLCGESAEPMNAVSGRAGRLAAAMAHSFLAREKRS